MSDTNRRVFISATTHDLGSYRIDVREALITAEILPIVQDNFSPDYREVTDSLREKIKTCDAVICLVGYTFGAAPPQLGDVLRSYTQLEYFVARELGKRIFLFLAAKSYVPDAPPEEPEDMRALQLCFRENLEVGTQLWMPFSTQAELRQRVTELVRTLPRARSGEILDLHPAAVPAYFTGRSTELEQLSMAARRASPSLIAVIGVGGQGKTTLVSHWLNLSNRPQFQVVFRCTAYRGGYTFDSFLDDALSFLLEGLFEKRNFTDVKARIQELMKLLQRQRILLVVDGMERWLQGWNAGRGDLHAAELPGDRSGYFDGLDDFLGSCAGLVSGSHLVITTRALPQALDDVSCGMIPVDENRRLTTLQGLEDESAVQLMRDLGVVGEDEEILQVAKSYSNHPLALTVLSRLLVKKFGGRIEELRRVSALDPKERLFQLLGEMHANLPQREASSRVLQVAGHCLEDPSLEVIAAGMGESVGVPVVHPDELLNVAVDLADWNLLQWDGTKAIMVLHPLIKLYFSGLAPDSEDIHRRLCEWYAKQHIPEDAASLQDARTHFLATEHALKYRDIPRCADLCFAPFTSRYCFTEWLAVWGHLDTGVELLGRLVREVNGDTRCEFLIPRAAMLRSLGQLPAARGDLDEVIATLSKAQVSNLDRQMILAMAYTNRGNVCRAMRKYKDAVADYDKALEISRKVSGDYKPAVLHFARALANRGIVLGEIGHLSRATADFDAAIQIFEVMRRDGQDVTAALANVQLSRANFLAELQRYAESIREYDQVIATYQQLLDKGNEEFRANWAHAHTMRGFAINGSGHFEEALQDHDRAVDILLRLVQMGRRDVEYDLAFAWMERSKAYMNLKQWHEASRDCERAVVTFDRLVKSGWDKGLGFLAYSLLNRSVVLHALGQRTAAAQDRIRGMDKYREIIRDGHTGGSTHFLHQLVMVSLQLVEDDPEVAAELLHEALAYVDTILQRTDSSEAFLQVLRRERRSLDEIITRLPTCDLEKINSLYYRLTQWYTQHT